MTTQILVRFPNEAHQDEFLKLMEKIMGDYCIIEYQPVSSDLIGIPVYEVNMEHMDMTGGTDGQP